MPRKWRSVVVFVVAGVLAGAADHDAVGLDGHRDRAVARPVLGVGRIVLHGRVEPEPVALLAVVERSLERLRLAGPGATAPAAAPTAPPARPLAVAVLAFSVICAAVLLVGGLVLVVSLPLGLALGLERLGDEGVVLGTQVRLLSLATRDEGLALTRLRRRQLV